MKMLHLYTKQKGTGRQARNNGNGRKRTETVDVVEQARQNVDSELATLVGTIRRDCECVAHSGRVCIVKKDGGHVQYDHNHFLEHARLLVSAMVLSSCI